MRAILTYHSVDETGSVISVTPSRFAEHVRLLATSEVRVLGVADLLACPDDGHAVAITFDDALANFATHAWPVLREHAFPVTVFVPTQFVGRQNDWSVMPGGAMPSLRLLDWEQIGRLAEAGVAVCAHSRTHPDLRRLTDAQLDDELQGSREDIARETGKAPAGFAYPYGFVDGRVAGRVRRSFQWACTTVLGALTGAEDPCLLPRLDSYYFAGPAALHNYGSASFRWYMSLRAALRHLRHLRSA